MSALSKKMKVIAIKSKPRGAPAARKAYREQQARKDEKGVSQEHKDAYKYHKDQVKEHKKWANKTKSGENISRLHREYA